MKFIIGKWNVRHFSAGEYGLEIYANDPTYEGDTYTHICQYMLYFQPPAGFRSKLQSHMPPATAKMYQANPRQMWNYEDHAPSIGTLPRPYLEAEADIMVQQVRKEWNPNMSAETRLFQYVLYEECFQMVLKSNLKYFFKFHIRHNILDNSTRLLCCMEIKIIFAGCLKLISL